MLDPVTSVRQCAVQTAFEQAQKARSVQVVCPKQTACHLPRNDFTKSTQCNIHMLSGTPTETYLILKSISELPVFHGKK